MQGISLGRPWILEVCPASTLKDLDIYWHYKGRSKDNSAARVHILERIEGAGQVLIRTPALRSRILDDQHRDALDSIVAAFVTFRALRNPVDSPILRTKTYTFEGYVYV